MTYWGNPTEGGRIQMKDEPWDGTSIRVTRTCADHQATNQGCSVDLGDGTAERWVIAPRAATVTFREDLQGIIRLDYGDSFGGGFAHMFPLLVTVGQAVAQGERIGQVGDAHDPALGPMAPHLHYDVLHNGAQQDPVPYLNMPVPVIPPKGEDVLQGTELAKYSNVQAMMLLNPTHFYGDPSTTNPTLAQFPPGTVIQADFAVDGAKVKGSSWWIAGWMPVGGVQHFGYLHESQISALENIEPTGGFTQADLDAAKAEGAATAEATWEGWVGTHP